MPHAPGVLGGPFITKNDLYPCREIFAGLVHVERDTSDSMDWVGSAGSPTHPSSIKRSGFRFLSTRGPEGWWLLRKAPDRRRRLWSLEATSFSRPAATAPITGVRSVGPAGPGPAHTHVTGQPVVFPSCVHLGVVTRMCGSELISRLLWPQNTTQASVSVSTSHPDTKLLQIQILYID